MSRLNQLKKDLRGLSDERRAKVSLWFFKTGKGEYGEGDKFLGLTSEQIKDVAKKYQDLNLADVKCLLISPIHEDRAAALRILVNQYQKAEPAIKKKMADFYLKNSRLVNNWDLVDMSAPNILGDYLLNKPRAILYKLAKSKNLWQRREAVVATLAFIRAGQFADTVKISELLLKDSHDLIHKAAGWMLREMGKRDLKELKRFLDKHHKTMPRVMLRYAIEKLSWLERKRYLIKN